MSVAYYNELSSEASNHAVLRIPYQLRASGLEVVVLRRKMVLIGAYPVTPSPGSTRAYLDLKPKSH